jgi:UDP-N-acetylmuramoyl-tripeptide--D-alanyl-D-alanine ligase
VALVNNAQREHQEFMGTVEAVARENGAAIAALGAGGVAVFPCDDAFTPVWRELAADRRVVTFSDTDASADVHALSAEWQDGAWELRFASPAGEQRCRLHIAGRHNVRNALAAAACAWAAGVSLAHIAQGLTGFEPVGGRSRALSLALDQRGVTLIDDTYNANPDSVVAAIRVLTELPSPRMLVLGDMGEVGEQGLAFHLEVLRQAMASGIEAVHCSGDWMGQAVDAMIAAGEPAPRHWTDMPCLITHVCNVVGAGPAPHLRSVLVKGSRFMRMERVVQALQALACREQQEPKDAPHAA